MRAGSLVHRVTITSRTDTPDGHQGFLEGQATICARVSAFISPLSGLERERALQIDPRSTHSVVMRYRRDVTARQLLTYHDGTVDRPFEIIGSPTTVEERRREMILLCKEAT